MKKILLVDDDQAIVEALTLVLEMEGYQVTSQTVGFGVVERVIKDRPDLVVLDIWLPDIDGDEIAACLKRESQTKSIPIILISAHDDLGKRIKRVEVNDYLAKPFDIQHLLEKIEKNINFLPNS